ncbi:MULTISPECIES: hypothetical protein [Flavobacteriaceae]|uniref:hypothetical protein n=1 Tax=Flavobacteriaceae TaxID=49546 RepID=UPI0014915899|nr:MULTISPECIES: hypothetical protein [Allomuricauda]MDC6364817.1 hypothetical protein [Muricauda sp. AC10]
MKEYILQAFGLYYNYDRKGTLQSFLELIENYESYGELKLKFPNKETKNEFKAILNKAWKEFIIGKDVYRVSHYINEIEAILI